MDRKQLRRGGVVLAARIESLELRRLLCGSPHGGAEVLHSAELAEGVYRPAVYFPEHIPLSEYLKLSPERQAAIDGHLIEDDRPESEQLAPLFENGLRITGDGSLPDALPDMVPLVGNGYLQPYIDKTEQPGRNLLRFSTAVGNMGDGPIILSSSENDLNPDGTQRVTQTIYARSGNSFVINRTRVGGNFVWHQGHQHFHYEGYADYRLLANVNGQPGSIVTRSDGTPAVGDKVGFCLINISNSFTLPGTSTSSSTLPNFNLAGQPGTSCGFLQGIHVGKADVYDSVFDGQWIDVTGVPNGNYFLEVTIDGSDTVLEKNEANNTVYVAVTLNTSDPTNGAGSIAPDRFEAPAPNNTFATATNLGELGTQNQAGLTIHTNYDEDYFRFTASSSGTGTISTAATHGDVNLFLYDADGVLLRSSTTSGNGTAFNPQLDSVSYSFVQGNTYYIRTDGLGSGTTSTSGRSNNYTLSVAIKPVVSVVNTRLKVSEGGTATLVFHRNGPTSSPLTLSLTRSGTATSGSDYVALPSSITIGNEASTYELPLVIRTDSVVEPAETVVITISTSSSYVLGTQTSIVVLIEDKTPPLNGSRPRPNARDGAPARLAPSRPAPGTSAPVVPPTTTRPTPATDRPALSDATSFLRSAGADEVRGPALFSARPVTALLESDV
jgi:hypothetical protein